jgi:hypothetical protein
MSAPAMLESQSRKSSKRSENADDDDATAAETNTNNINNNNNNNDDDDKNDKSNEQLATRLAALRDEVSLVGASETGGEATRMRMNEFDEAVFDNTDAALKSELVRILVQVSQFAKHVDISQTHGPDSIWKMKDMSHLRSHWRMKAV